MKNFAFDFGFVSLYGKPLEKNKFDHPYSYDCYVTWQSPDYERGYNFVDGSGLDFIYSDRMLQWDYDKFVRCSNEVWSNSGQVFSTREPAEIEKFLRLYFDNEHIQLVVIGEGANPSSGYPYWVFGYKQK